MSTAADPIRYATAEDVLQAISKSLSTVPVPDDVTNRARQRAAAATQNWINRTGRPYHEVRVGAADEPQSWETHDVHEVRSRRPVTVHLDHKRILPIDPAEGDTIEVRTGRDTWEDITDRKGDDWALANRTRRLSLYRRRLNLLPFDDPRERFVRLTYRYGPLGEEVTINDNNVVTSVPADVSQAIAAKAATQLALDDELKRSISDDGQLTDPSTKRSALESTWEDTIADHTGFSPL